MAIMPATATNSACKARTGFMTALSLCVRLGRKRHHVADTCRRSDVKDARKDRNVQVGFPSSRTRVSGLGVPLHWVGSDFRQDARRNSLLERESHLDRHLEVGNGAV